MPPQQHRGEPSWVRRLLAPPHGACDSPSIAAVAPAAGAASGRHAPLAKLLLLRVVTALSLSHPITTNERHMCLLRSYLRVSLFRVVRTQHCTCAINSQFVNETKRGFKHFLRLSSLSKPCSGISNGGSPTDQSGQVKKRRVFYSDVVCRLLLGLAIDTCSTAESHTITRSNQIGALNARAPPPARAQSKDCGRSAGFIPVRE